MKKLTFVAANFVLCCAMVSRALYAQNAVTDWGTIVQSAINTPPAPLPAKQMVLRAMVQIAVFDAVVAIEGGYKPFASSISAPSDADVRAAVATAAFLTAQSRLGSLLPQAVYDNYMTAIPDGIAKEEGRDVGRAAAEAVILLRADDGMGNVVPYECSGVPPAGVFEPNGGCGTLPLGTDVPQIRPFTFSNQAQFRPGGPNPLTSSAYVEDFVETRDFGRADSTVRTAEQTDIAYFWQLVNTHKAITDLAISRNLNVLDAARLFAMVYTAAADANIAGFEAKYFYKAWRPRTAIPRADTDGNPDTLEDLTWTPLISVNHPEYPSAHSFSTTAIADTIARFFGTNKVTWKLTAVPTLTMPLQVTERTYYDLNSVMREIYDARVWAGLHWRHSMLDGAQVGRKVSKYVCDHFFQAAE